METALLRRRPPSPCAALPRVPARAAALSSLPLTEDRREERHCPCICRAGWSARGCPRSGRCGGRRRRWTDPGTGWRCFWVRSFVRTELPGVPPRDGLVMPLRSHNPVTIALHAWAPLLHDLRRARGWRQRLRGVFGPRGAAVAAVAADTPRSWRRSWRPAGRRRPPRSPCGIGAAAGSRPGPGPFCGGARRRRGKRLPCLGFRFFDYI